MQASSMLGPIEKWDISALGLWFHLALVSHFLSYILLVMDFFSQDCNLLLPTIIKQGIKNEIGSENLINTKSES
jgi:hypothetical protein